MLYILCIVSSNQKMRQLIIGIGGITNGGKSTLATSLHARIPNSCLIAQDTFFKDNSLVPVDSRGFKQYDVIDSLNMDEMMREVQSWQKDPAAFVDSYRLRSQRPKLLEAPADMYTLIIEGFLIYNYRPLNELIDMKYFLHIPYEICKERRCLRTYNPPDPCGYFDGHVWPMYLKNRNEMEDKVSDLVYLDGTQSREKIFADVYKRIKMEMDKLPGKD
ncbi:nicotinamide riboside kinase 1-like isoform X2 [Brienomyrus brachyistius]|uniref:nicotinamide riboside kinase 1-like isoform X2 n=1 Tax=Brienomyrus brachyistius TaxID=42636 RepID=UPI0020B45FF3|nr:nicotinamide riboside kinase 1-like isoform X2 [Brienomyrus brachyistius]